MNLQDIKNKKIVVMGLGLNQGGLGTAKWLLRHGASLVVTDLKDRRLLAASIAALDKYRTSLIKKTGRRNVGHITYVLGRHRESDFRSADMVIQNPGVPRESRYLKVARAAGVPIESDISIFFRLVPQLVIGVSGTKGKTTTVAMLGAMLRADYGRAIVAGNIRKSPLDELDALMGSTAIVPIALELSSWQLESLAVCERSPQISVLTNVLPDHLNRYRGMKDYAAAKELIYAWQFPDDVAIVPFDNPYTRAMGERVVGERYWASLKPVADGQNGLYYRRADAVIRKNGEETRLFKKDDVRIPGEHNLWNALLAAGTAYLRGVKPAIIRRALRGFKGVEHRMEFIREWRGVKFWNDSAATTPEASVAAMKTFADRKRKNTVLVAGGADKELVFGEWARVAKKLAKSIILLDGSATPKMLTALKKVGIKNLPIVRDMKTAVGLAVQMARRGDHVLLSPGCASFGIFVNEFDRGDQFRLAVKKQK